MAVLNARRASAGRAEALWLLVSALLTAALFASGALDMEAARWFYRPEAADHWPFARQFPWPLLYRAATPVTAALVIAALGALGASFTATRHTWRQPAVLVLLAVAIGPGLLGNALFKDHWQHPRPRELTEFGGAAHYVAAPIMGHEGGASFPCGHCTVGFLYASGWWIWKRKRPAWAAVSLATGLTLGLLLGIGRLAAGGHFLSDIIWSALLAFGVLHVLWYHVLRLHVPRVLSECVPRAATLAALLGGAAVLIALFAAPHGTVLASRLPLPSGGPPRSLEVDADRADIDVILVDASPPELRIDGELHGFGLPGSDLGARLEVVSRPAVLRYRIEEHGWLTDVDASVTLRVPAAAFTRVSVTVHRGDIQVRDLTAARVVSSQRVRLELHTDRGRIQWPAGPRQAIPYGSTRLRAFLALDPLAGPHAQEHTIAAHEVMP